MSNAKKTANEAVTKICRIPDRMAELGLHRRVGRDDDNAAILVFSPDILNVLDEFDIDWSDADVLAATAQAYPDQADNMDKTLQALREVLEIKADVEKTPWPDDYQFMETPWEDPTWERKEEMDRALTKLFKYSRPMFAIIRDL